MIVQYTFNALENQSFTLQITDCLNQLDKTCPPQRRLGLLLFIAAESNADYFSKRRQIASMMDERGLNLPCNVLTQACPGRVTMEVWEETEASELCHPKLGDLRYTVAHTKAGKNVWAFGIASSDESIDLNGQIEYAFQSLVQILNKEELELSDIVRQWNYVPEILELITRDEKCWQHYQLFNEIRQKYYQTSTFTEGYPAATGIGTANGPFALDFFAIRTHSKVRKTGLSNPRQADAYAYEQKHLVGDAFLGKTKKAPLFERAKFLETKHSRTLFLSGTASIIGQETVGIGDIDRQCRVTADNMLELLSAFEQKNGGSLSSRFTYLRAYIKQPEDAGFVKRFCEQEFPGVSLSCLIADVCRSELLVEMEGEAVLEE